MSWGKLAPVLIATVVITFCAMTALLFYLHASPSTEELEADLENVRSQLAAADADAAKYSSGFLLATIEVRREVLKTTEALLQQKRDSFLRRVDLRYTVAADPVVQSGERLEEIAGEIAKADAKLVKDQAEADNYSGGLIQALALSNVAMDRLLITQLSLAYYGAKYGFVAPKPKVSNDAAAPELPGVPVNDKDAF
jgi:hypothetical protein